MEQKKLPKNIQHNEFSKIIRLSGYYIYEKVCEWKLPKKYVKCIFCIEQKTLLKKYGT